MTIEEIRELVYQTDDINWIDVLKELVKIKFGENKLIKLENKCGWGPGIFLHDRGDLNRFLIGVAVINDILFVETDDGDGYNVDFGTTWIGEDAEETKGIGLTKYAIIKACRKIFDELTTIVFDFEKKEDLYDGWYEDYFLERIENYKEKFDSFVKGETKGYLSIT